MENRPNQSGSRRARFDIPLLTANDFRAAFDACRGDTKVWNALQSRWIWQDQLMWKRTEMLLAIQGASLAAGHTFGSLLGALILLLGGTLSSTLLRLAWLDERNRDRTADLMNALLLSNLPRDQIAAGKAGWYLSGGGILKLVMILFVVVDFVFSGYLVAHAITKLQFWYVVHVVTQSQFLYGLLGVLSVILGWMLFRRATWNRKRGVA